MQKKQQQPCSMGVCVWCTDIHELAHMWVLRANKLTMGELLKMDTRAAPSHTSSARDLPLKESHGVVCDKCSICSSSAGYSSPCLRFLLYDSFQGKRDGLWRNTQRFVEGKDTFRPLVVNTRRNTFFFSAVPVKFSLFGARRCNSRFIAALIQ